MRVVLGTQLAVRTTLCIHSVNYGTVIAGESLAHSCKLVNRAGGVGKVWRYSLLASLTRLPVLKE